MRTFCLLITLFICQISFSQDLKKKIDDALNKLAVDEQFKHSVLSFYVVEGKTGKVLYDKNSEVGLAPASCQKIVTSVTAFEILGKDYRYQTSVKIYPGSDSINLFIAASGDPTIGSWRWGKTKMDSVYSQILNSLKNKKLTAIACDIAVLKNDFTYQPIPDGWVWQDIGNYYGAGTWAFNWHENQYSISLSSDDKEGTLTEIKSFDPASANMFIQNFITAGKKGSGDNAYIYSAPYTDASFATGTITPGQNQFTISGSMPDPTSVFIKGLKSYLNGNGINVNEGHNLAFALSSRNPSVYENIGLIYSPSLDSINYWFLKKSINLYGEAFVKTIALEKTKIGSTDSGVNVIRNFWADKGIEKSSLKIIDGSGLSPANRLTTSSLVSVLQYAGKRPWFSSFYNALPEMNGIKMKDGYIGGVRSYTGYVTSASGVAYSFAFIVNNFDGNPATVREKMWRVLDLLK
ncbi:MAG: D-alanyl-D-alanine carboxypeptidase/D-alanyl-D-alanine-endopeptidase [Ferruginibacter sp.]